MPAQTRHATSTEARREKRRNAARRSSGAAGQTTATSWTSPPIQSVAAERWIQSASSESHDEPASAAEWPESERPDAKPSPSKNAGQRKSVRSGSHERESSAATNAKPSVIAMKASPKR